MFWELFTKCGKYSQSFLCLVISVHLEFTVNISGLVINMFAVYVSDHFNFFQIISAFKRNSFDETFFSRVAYH